MMGNQMQDHMMRIREQEIGWRPAEHYDTNQHRQALPAEGCQVLKLNLNRVAPPSSSKNLRRRCSPQAPLGTPALFSLLEFLVPFFGLGGCGGALRKPTSGPWAVPSLESVND